jgi:hypothetical protein
MQQLGALHSSLHVTKNRELTGFLQTLDGYLERVIVTTEKQEAA